MLAGISYMYQLIAAIVQSVRRSRRVLVVPLVACMPFQRFVAETLNLLNESMSKFSFTVFHPSSSLFASHSG